MHGNFLLPYHQTIYRRDIWRVLADELVLQEMISSADKVWKIQEDSSGADTIWQQTNT
jgi:hypothetical protein